MAETLTLDVVKEAVAGSAAAFRCRRRLQPGGGQGDKVFPPTFAGAVYAIEHRRLPGREEPVACVLLDSVQSQANRMEQALQEALDAGKIKMPLLVVDFSQHDPTGDLESDKAKDRLIDKVGKVTTLQVPHRLADAILRDSEIDGVAFRQTEVGKALNTVGFANATPLFKLCPTALIFGMWDSTGPKGGLGPKFERAMVSEVVGIGAEYHGDYRARGVRRDPLEIRAAVKIVKNADGSWRVAQGDKKALAPSKVNHSSVPFDSANSGVTVEYAVQVTTLSLICLRRLRFPRNGEFKAEVDRAARTVLAALGLCSATMAFEAGMGLRSRCLLWPEDVMTWDLLDKPGQTPKAFSLTGETALKILQEAVDGARREGLPWQEEPVELKPSENLVKLVRLSQLEATKEEAEGGD
jgi:CRISPR-associated protein Csb1